MTIVDARLRRFREIFLSADNDRHREEKAQRRRAIAPRAGFGKRVRGFDLGVAPYKQECL